MVLPLNEVNKIEQYASKPGNLIDKYIKVQDINNAVSELKRELIGVMGTNELQKMIFDKINFWLGCKNGIKN